MRRRTLSFLALLTLVSGGGAVSQADRIRAQLSDVITGLHTLVAPVVTDVGQPLAHLRVGAKPEPDATVKDLQEKVNRQREELTYLQKKAGFEDKRIKKLEADVHRLKAKARYENMQAESIGDQTASSRGGVLAYDQTLIEDGTQEMDRVAASIREAQQKIRGVTRAFEETSSGQMSLEVNRKLGALAEANQKLSEQIRNTTAALRSKTQETLDVQDQIASMFADQAPIGAAAVAV